MRIIENEFTVKAGRGAFRKARKKAFALLKTHGHRNYISVEVISKRGEYNSNWQLHKHAIYECMIYVEKHTENVRMYEFFRHGKYNESIKTLFPKDHPWLKGFEF